ncbi:MAG: hypothetical protein QOD93_6589 [Acetobacteraceae bacterium]|jgi:hypothetical protein|nr:hypothetical protein [Acetobacteraceae bacterium]
MTETNTSIEAATQIDVPLRLNGILMNLIVALLAPMFLGVTGGDIDFARMAAVETVNAYRARNRADLIAIAQIIAFGLAALGSLSLSMADDITVSMALRLRGNANACNRSAEQNRRALAKSLGDESVPQHPEMTAEPETPDVIADYTETGYTETGYNDADTFLSATAAQVLAAESLARLQGAEQTAEPGAISPRAQIGTHDMTPNKRHQAMWAIAMVKESGEINDSLPNLSPADREAAILRAAQLSRTAHDLIYRSATPPLSPDSLAGISPPELSGSR